MRTNFDNIDHAIEFRKNVFGEVGELEISALRKAQGSVKTVKLIRVDSYNNSKTMVMENLGINYSKLGDKLNELTIKSKIIILIQLFEYIEYLTSNGLSIDDGNINNIYINHTFDIKVTDFSQYAKNEIYGYKHFSPIEQMYRFLKKMDFGSYADITEREANLSDMKRIVLELINNDYHI